MKINADSQTNSSVWSYELVRAADQFVAQATSIAEINHGVIPEMEAKADPHGMDSLEEVYKHLSAEDLDEFSRIARKLAQGILEYVDHSEKGGSVKPFTLKVRGSAGAALNHMIAYSSRFLSADPQHQLLRNSLLVSSISGFEILFGCIARAILKVNRAAFKESDHGFTLQQLSEFDSLSDAQEFLIERQVSKLLHESIDGWDKWIKQASGGLCMSNLPVDWMVIREGFARRNLMVHADGVVNQLYLGALKKLDARRDWGAQTGERLNVGEEYLSRFLQELIALGRLLSVAVGCRMHKRDESFFLGSIQMDIYRSTMSQSWRTVIALSEYSMRCNPPRVKRIQAQVSSWVARKALFGLDEIKDEVESWDVTGLAVEYSHCKSVLLDNKEEAIAQIRRLLATKKLTVFEVAVNPLYGELREFLADGSPDRLPAEVENSGEDPG
ncbi:hypothetical protein [Streptomyces sp. NPDC021212]|uniref:hypothetical protein n=1 Tax=Streptomyces sp. NPDC021212 TaxID=3365118 RepID=UPI00378D42AB